MDMDSSGRIVVGGGSKDTSIVSSNSNIPIVYYIMDGGYYFWAKQFPATATASDYSRVICVKFNPTADQVAVAFEQKTS